MKITYPDEFNNIRQYNSLGELKTDFDIEDEEWADYETQKISRGKRILVVDFDFLPETLIELEKDATAKGYFCGNGLTSDRDIILDEGKDSRLAIICDEPEDITGTLPERFREYSPDKGPKDLTNLSKKFAEYNPDYILRHV